MALVYTANTKLTFYNKCNHGTLVVKHLWGKYDIALNNTSNILKTWPEHKRIALVYTGNTKLTFYNKWNTSKILKTWPVHKRIALVYTANTKLTFYNKCNHGTLVVNPKQHSRAFLTRKQLCIHTSLVSRKSDTQDPMYFIVTFVWIMQVDKNP